MEDQLVAGLRMVMISSASSLSAALWGAELVLLGPLEFLIASRTRDFDGFLGEACHLIIGATAPFSELEYN